MKKLLVVCLALIMVLGSMSVAFADVTEAGSTGTTPVTLTTTAATFSVTVPTGLGISVAADGTVTCADAAKIINNGAGAVKVTAISVEAADGWTIVNFGKDMSGVKVGAKEVGFEINELATTAEGALNTTNLATAFPAIAAKNDGATDELAITYDATVSAQSSALDDVKVLDVVFTIGWDAN